MNLKLLLETDFLLKVISNGPLAGMTNDGFIRLLRDYQY